MIGFNVQQRFYNIMVLVCVGLRLAMKRIVVVGEGSVCSLALDIMIGT